MLGGTALLVGYAHGRLSKGQESRKREELKRKADEICDPVPEEAVLYKTVVSVIPNRITAACTKCPCSTQWT